VRASAALRGFSLPLERLPDAKQRARVLTITLEVGAKHFLGIGCTTRPHQDSAQVFARRQ
jgi:hypothetical protein